ncbi:MAG: S-layer homology domain-containing protein [Clostridiales bacterium]|jgi:hypothetical protein|nr:S-layer homology domain-containing protein [Clostridiales bacterium]
MKRIIRFLIILAIVLMVSMHSNTNRVEAAGKYITIEEFIEYIVTQMKWPVVDVSKQPYIETAIARGILKKSDFSDYKEYLTRTDAAVIANRLDEYINQKYGYSQEVYDFLRDCYLYENTLYYDLNGKFFPKGETDQTYDAHNFGNDVAHAILLKAFPNDSWVERGLRTRYEDVRERRGDVRNTFVMIGVNPNIERNFFGIYPFDEDSLIVKAWNTIKDGDRKVKAVLDKRISDIKSIPKGKQEAVASIVAKGIIKGYSNGIYVQNREFRGKNNITAKGAKDVIQKVLNPSIRALISPDGQLIRTTKLPKNASDYEYILECFPNRFYEMDFDFINIVGFKEGTVRRSIYAYPIEVDYDYLYENHYKYQFELDMDKYELYDKALNQVEKYIEHIFNVDYRTVNDKWKNGLIYTLDQYYDWRLSGWIDEYIEAIKKNHVIVECEHVAIEPSTLYKCIGGLYVRVYVKYKITAKNINAPSEELLYGDMTYLKGVENGKWRYGYYDIGIGSCYSDGGHHWGVNTLNSISDSMFLMSK